MKDDFKYGEDYILKGRYDAALAFYLRLYNEKKENANINYRIGECYYHIYEERFKSIPYLEAAKKNITANYIPGKFENHEAPLEVFLLLGDIYLKKNVIDQAYINYMEYKKNLNRYDIDKLKDIEKRLQDLATAYQLISQSVSYADKEEIPNLNSRFSDYHPVIAKDESKIIYTSFWESADLIFIMEKKRGEWTKPVDISEQLASNGDTYASSITNSGKTLYFINRGHFNSDIYTSNLSGKQWNFMMPVENKKINSKYNETDVFVTFDGKTMYFASDRKEGKGGYDIYIAKKEGTEWGDPVNAGDIINTEYDEGGPYLTPDNKYFIFSSEGHKSMGGKDLFFCELRKDGSFSKPINFGNMFNTPEDEQYLAYFNETSTAYYAVDTKDPSKRVDIFKYTIHEEMLAEAIKQNKESIPLASINTDAEYIENLKYSLNISKSAAAMPIAEASLTATEPVIVSPPILVEEVTFPDEEVTIPVENIQYTIEEPELPLSEENEYNNEITVTETPVQEDITPVVAYEETAEKGSSDITSYSIAEDNALIQVMSHKQYDKIEVPSSTSDNPVFIEVKFDPSYRPNPYTVQIAALKNYRDPLKQFPEFKALRIFGGADGYYRYVLGDYWTLEAAKKSLEQTHELGYKSAFIRLVRSIPMK